VKGGGEKRQVVPWKANRKDARYGGKGSVQACGTAGSPIRRGLIEGEGVALKGGSSQGGGRRGVRRGKESRLKEQGVGVRGKVTRGGCWVPTRREEFSLVRKGKGKGESKSQVIH